MATAAQQGAHRHLRPPVRVQDGRALTFPEELHVALLQVEAEVGEVVLQDAPCTGGRCGEATGDQSLADGTRGPPCGPPTGECVEPDGPHGWEQGRGAAPTDELHGCQLQVLVGAPQVDGSLHEKLVTSAEVALHLGTGDGGWWPAWRPVAPDLWDLALPEAPLPPSSSQA